LILEHWQKKHLTLRLNNIKKRINSMNHELEFELYNRIKLTGKFPRDIIDEMLKENKIKSPKQAWRTLEKWSAKRLYDYGSTLDLGWLED